VIGAGRVGGSLAKAAERAGLACRLVRRNDGWDALDADAGHPIVVATRNDDLDSVLARVPQRRLVDLVFTQNGMLRPWLAANGLSDNTRGLLFFAVPARGDDLTPGGTSPFCGLHAEAVVAMFDVLGIPSVAVTDKVFATVELEKLVWNSAFGLLCEAYDCAVGATLAHPSCDGLLRELIDMGARDLGLDVDVQAMVGRLRAYSASIASYRGAVKEWPWRNGYFVALADRFGGGEVHRSLLSSLGPLLSGVDVLHREGRA
jgi:hypothetical protein